MTKTVFLYFQWLMIVISSLNGLAGIVSLGTIIFMRCTIVQLKKRPFEEKRLWPSVSIIVPIHNEQYHLEPALTSLCCLDYSHYEVIAVNDRSTDSSNEIVLRLSKKFSHLTCITIEKLPPDWLGKTNALHEGLKYATGEYVIFTDADVIFEPSLVNRAIDLMITQQLDHLTLSPRIKPTHFFMKLLMPFLLYIMLLAMKPWQSKSTNSKDIVGIGAFNCVNRQSFILCGGMEKLALNPIDDLGLARLIKKHGFKQAIADAEELLTLTWYETLTDCKKGFEKNIFAFFDFNIGKSIIALIVFLNFIYLPWIMLLLFPKIGLIGNMLAILSVVFAVMLSCHQLKISKKYALGYPIAALITLFIGLRSVGLCLLRKGIYWGGAFFPLSKLIVFMKSDSQ